MRAHLGIPQQILLMQKMKRWAQHIAAPIDVNIRSYSVAVIIVYAARATRAGFLAQT